MVLVKIFALVKTLCSSLGLTKRRQNDNRVVASQTPNPEMPSSDRAREAELRELYTNPEFDIKQKCL